MQVFLSLPRWLHIAAVALATSVQPLVSLQAIAQQPPATEPVPAVIAAQSVDPGDAEVGEVSEDGSALLRGPVHEAFAEQFSMNVTPSEVIAKEPPQPIDEVPPEFRPEGENIQWIPGYWGCDIESEDFVWVTGVWRAVPPDQQWIPGYWTEAEDGWQWISGFWTSAQTEQLVYMPLPPESIEAGPSVPAPGDDYFWIPGSWQYDQAQNTQNQYGPDPYNWQAGYWSQGHEDWVWIPSRYVWTPSGCIYREGYWDYVVQSRGTIFCPMAFRSGYRQQFRPRYVVETGPLWLANLFVLPGLNHYAFGNYYGYRGNRQIYPWVNYYQTSRGYDPLFSYYAYQNRNTNLIRQIARVERQIANNPLYRAQPTVAAQLRAINNLQGTQANWALRAVQLNTLATQSNLDFDTPFQFASIDADRRTQLINAITPARELAQQRRELEKANTREDRQRAVRAEAQANTRTDAQANAKADARSDATAENRDRAQADRAQTNRAQTNRDQADRGQSRQDDNDGNPNAGAAVSGKVKRLAIRAEGGANGQRRLAQADPQSAERPSINPTSRKDGKADSAGKNTTESNNNRASNVDRPNPDRPNLDRSNPDKPANETDDAKRRPGAGNDQPGLRADSTPGRTSDSDRPRTQTRGDQTPANQNPTMPDTKARDNNARENNRNINPSDRANPNGRDRNPAQNSLQNNPLDRIQQGLDDKNSPDDARALRDMMRRVPRTSASDNPNTNTPGARNSATAGDRPNRDSTPSANNPAQPNRSQPNPSQNRNPLGNGSGIRPPSLPRQNPGAGAPGRDATPGPAARPPRSNPAGPGSTPNAGARPNANPGNNPGGNAGGNRGGTPPDGNRATGGPAGGNPPATKAPAGNAAPNAGRAASGNPAGRPGGNNRSEGRPNKEK